MLTIKQDIEEKLFRNSGFPDPLDPVKGSMAFGLSVAKAIENEWFRRHRSGNSRYFDDHFKFHNLRLYARAEQSVAKYKNELSVQGDLSFLSLDWTPLPILPKMHDIVTNGISNRLFSIKAQAVDKIANNRRNSYAQELQKDMAAKEQLLAIKQQTGVDGFVNNPDTLPETPEELEIHMQLNFKQAVEIAEEEAVDYIFKVNEFQEVKKRFDSDIVTLGKAAMKHSYNPSDGIKIEYVDPALLVHSYSEDPNHADCYYFGEIKRIPVSELKKINPNISPEQLEKAKSITSDWDSYHRVNESQSREFMGHMTNIMFFCYKATREKVYKKKTLKNGMVKVTRKPEGWNPDPMDMMERGYEKFVKFEDVWYEGVLILGTDVLLKWEVAENMVRDQATNRPLSPYVVVTPRTYDDRSESLVARMIPIIDQIQLVHLKLQQVAARVVPDGIYIDVDGLAEIDLGDGQAYSPKKAMQLYFQTGSVVGRSQTAMGEFNHGKIPIQEINNSGGRIKLQALIETYNMYMQMLRDVTGLNEARDGSMPDSRTLVGVQKLAALNSNTATRHVLDAGVYATKKLAEAVSLRVSDLLKYSDTREELIDAIGTANVTVLSDIKDLPLHRFGIFIEVSPDAEEREYLEQNIQAAVAGGLIYLEDAAEIRELRNTKIAHQVMKIRREKKQKMESQLKMQEFAAQSEEQTKTAMAQAQAKMQAEQAKAQGLIELETVKHDLLDRNQEREKNRKIELMALEFEYNMKMKGVEADFTLEQKAADEDIRQREIDRQATQQSVLAAQTDTENGLSNRPVNFAGNSNPVASFESEEDSLDGFDLGQFDPR